MEILSKKWLFISLGILCIVSLLTNFYGNTDIYDYSDTAKFFAGKYNAKIRTSHSYLYGLIHAPLVYLTESFFIFKITSLLSLTLLIFSVYIISNKNKNSLWLMAFSPIVWYLGPWISPIQLSSLIFLWAYFFIEKYNLDNRIKHLFFAGALMGLSWAFWDGILFFIPLLMISFLYDKKLIHSIYFIAFILVGVLPRLILDHYLFGFAFFGIIRHIMASLTLTIYGGFYNQGSLAGIGKFIWILVFLPISSYLILKRNSFKTDKKSSIFILLSVTLLIINSQIRFVLLVTPIIILLASKSIEKKQVVSHLTISLIIILLLVNPYIIQIKYDIEENGFLEGHEIGSLVESIKNIEFKEDFQRDIIKQDLEQIGKDYQHQVFVVGNRLDSYQTFADIYWGKDIEEFVSIQDYKLNLEDNPIISQKEFCSNVIIRERRDICTSVYIIKAFNDKTDYESINYALSEEENIDLDNFVFVKKYQSLSIFKKV